MRLDRIRVGRDRAKFSTQTFDVRVDRTIERNFRPEAERRGYEVKTIRASWIPVLYPTAAREEAEKIDAFLDAYFAGKTGRKGKKCPF